MSRVLANTLLRWRGDADAAADAAYADSVRFGPGARDDDPIRFRTAVLQEERHRAVARAYDRVLAELARHESIVPPRGGR